MHKQIDLFRILVLLVLMTFFSCNQNQDKKTLIIEDFETIEYSEESVSPLEIVNKRDTLIISFEGTECGEWGGHQETIFLLRQDDNKIIARILIDEVPCDDIVERNGVGILNPEKRKTITDYTKVLEENDEKLFSDFLQRLMELYLKPLVLGNFGSFYKVKNTDNSLNLRYWNSGNVMNTNYQTLKNEVFGELKKMPAAIP